MIKIRPREEELSTHTHKRGQINPLGCCKTKYKEQDEGGYPCGQTVPDTGAHRGDDIHLLSDGGGDGHVGNGGEVITELGAGTDGTQD